MANQCYRRLSSAELDLLVALICCQLPQLDPFRDAFMTPKDERDIAKELDRIMSDLESDQALAFHGEPLSEEDKELLKISLENSLRLARELAKKKFTPKKYRD